jgi:hypothetical protein
VHNEFAAVCCGLRGFYYHFYVINQTEYHTNDDFAKNPFAVLRCILRHCSVRKVRFIPQDLRALHLELFTKPSELLIFSEISLLDRK